MSKLSPFPVNFPGVFVPKDPGKLTPILKSLVSAVTRVIYSIARNEKIKNG